MTTLTIRQATSDDAPELARLLDLFDHMGATPEQVGIRCAPQPISLSSMASARSRSRPASQRAEQLDRVEAFGHVGHQRGPVDGGVGGEHRRGVHQVADALLRGRRRAAAVPLQQPAQAAPAHAVHGGRGDRDRRRRGRRAAGRRRAPAAPTTVPGRRRARRRRPAGPARRRRPGAARRTVSGEVSVTRSSATSAGRVSPRGGVADCHLVDAVGQLVEEPARLLLAVAGRRPP